MPSSTLQLLHASVTSEPRYYGQVPYRTAVIDLSPQYSSFSVMMDFENMFTHNRNTVNFN